MVNILYAIALQFIIVLNKLNPVLLFSHLLSSNKYLASAK